MSPETARPFIDIHAPVAQALAAGRPVVALESTIITHGMPYPDNGAMAANVEKIISDGGAIPATIAVVGGRIKIGLSDGERESLAMTGDAMKLSRADLGFAVAQGRTGGTTVAATMIAAEMVGIKVFATGGIGGVHKGAEKSFDISADLDELARTPVIVVSAGGQGDPRHRKDAGSAGDARRACRRPWLRDHARLLVAAVAVPRPADPL
ncbi:pseudouridine-5'-phosphate glycosidase [Mesorhizobium jarvisii]